MRTTLSECQAALEAENGFLLQKWKSGRADAQSEELWRGRDRQGTTAQAHQRPATVARRSTDPTLPRSFAAFPHVPVSRRTAIPRGNRPIHCNVYCWQAASSEFSDAVLQRILIPSKASRPKKQIFYGQADHKGQGQGVQPPRS